MTYPSEIPAVRTALLAYTTAPEEAAAAVAAAQGVASPVVQFVQVFDALKPHVSTLDSAGLELLAGCSHLIAANAWHGKGEEAFTVRDQAVAALAALA